MKKKLAIIVIVLILAAPAHADDLALVTLTDSKQAQQATEILGNAYGKVGDKFLVLVDQDRIEALAEAGISWEPVLEGIDSRSGYVILPRRPGVLRTTTDVTYLGRGVDLANGTRVAELSRLEASSLSSQGEYMVVSLENSRTAFHYLPPVMAAPLAPADSYPADTLVAHVDIDSVYAFNSRLEAFYTRYIWTDSIDRARDWMVQKFLDWGYTDVTTPEVEYDGGILYNVMAVKPGWAEPEKVIVVGAHYDAITYGQPQPAAVYAPGADDDGSGTAVVLELARVLAEVPLRKTVIFMPFTAEEVGLVGSRAAAQEFRANGTDLEFMFNLDMVGYTGGQPFNINLQSGTVDLYKLLTGAAADRVTSLTPFYVPQSGSSDHASFRNQGFNIVYAAETNFNIDGWHTVLDITSRMDFPYLTEVAKMTLASVAIVAESPSPATVEDIVDIGNGQALEVRWNPCYSDNSHIIYQGETPGSYTQSVEVGPGVCSYAWDGLAEGVRSYFLVIGVSPDGYQAVYGVEGSEEPLVYPRAPQNPLADADSARINISWEANREADLAYYNVYRRTIESSPFQIYKAHIVDTLLVDSMVSGQIEYSYRITAVDYDENESVTSSIVSSYAATFDGGVGLADAFSTENQYLPTQEEQEAFFDSLMAGMPYGLTILEEENDFLSRSDIGPYSSIFWIDDDVTRKTIMNSEETLEWYAGFGTNLLLSGYAVWLQWAPTDIPADHLLYREFMLDGYDYSGSPDFVGAHGQNGWPSVQIDPDRGLTEWPNIPVLETRPGAVVIYTYDSWIDPPGIEGPFEGLPAGIAYDGPNGKRVVLSFPLYYLTPASSQALMSKILSYFDETFVPAYYGDLNGDEIVDIGDLTRLIDYLYLGGEPLSNPNAADVDSNCIIDIGDLTKLIAYLFINGPDLLPGCVE